MREHFPELVFDTVIPRNVRIGEAPSFGLPVTHHDPHCAGADAYFELARGGGGAWLEPPKNGAHRKADFQEALPRRAAAKTRGMGRGLAAILAASPREEPRGAAPARRSS